MLKLHLREVLQHAEPVLVVLSHKARHVQVGVDAIAQSEVVSFSEDCDSMGEGPLATNSFLESSTGGASAVHFSIEQTDVDELAREGQYVRTHDVGSVSPGETPADIASRIAHVGTHAVVSQVDVVHQCLLEDRDEFGKSGRQEQASSAEFSERQTTSMPRRVSLRRPE